jgi:phage-related holin
LANELLSILENAGRAGLPIPDKLQNAVDVLKNDKKGA